MIHLHVVGSKLMSVSHSLKLSSTRVLSKQFVNSNFKTKEIKLNSHLIYALFQLYQNTCIDQDLKHGTITRK